MIKSSFQYRVPYSQVDKMGFLYHSHYLELFDLGRTELLRNFGFSVLDLEKQGYELPVCKVEISYKSPAFLDDILEIRTFIKKKPGVVFQFQYEIYKQLEEKPITLGTVKLAFMDAKTKKAVRPPQFILDLMSPYFTNE